MISKKKVAQLCKKRRSLRVCTLKDGSQWVGTGGAFYVMDGIPKMKPEQYATVFDFSQKDVDEAVIAEIDISDLIVCEDEIIVQSEPLEFIYKGEKYVCFSESGVSAIIPETQLAPVIMDESTAFYIKFGEIPVVSVKQGLFQEAIIGAMKFPETMSKSIISSLYDVIDAVQYNTGKAETADDGQLHIDGTEGQE